MKLFKRDPVRKMQKAYESKMKEAMEAQRGGAIQVYAQLHGEAEALLQKLRNAEAEGK